MKNPVLLVRKQCSCLLIGPAANSVSRSQAVSHLCLHMLPSELGDFRLQARHRRLLLLDQVKVSRQALQLCLLALLLQGCLLLLQTQVPLQAVQLRAQLVLLQTVLVLQLLVQEVSLPQGDQRKYGYADGLQ